MDEERKALSSTVLLNFILCQADRKLPFHKSVLEEQDLLKQMVFYVAYCIMQSLVQSEARSASDFVYSDLVPEVSNCGMRWDHDGLVHGQEWIVSCCCPTVY